MDLSRVPRRLRFLSPLVCKWGIGDDFEREQRVSRASVSELHELVTSIEGVSDELFSWLTGPESTLLPVSDEYAQFTSFTMAIDAARLKLGRRVEP